MSHADLRRYADDVLQLPADARPIVLDRAVQVFTGNLWPLIEKADRITLSGPTSYQREVFTTYVPLAVHRLIIRVPKKLPHRMRHVRELASSTLALCEALTPTREKVNR